MPLATSFCVRTRPRSKEPNDRDYFMSPHVHVDPRFGEFPVPLTLILLPLAFVYLLGWISVRSSSEKPVPAWKAVSFFLGLLLIWVAWGPFAMYDHSLLTVHMIKHLLLMTFAPALILLGDPLKLFWRGLPMPVRSALSRPLERARVQRLGRILTAPALCLTVSALTLVAWHLPALFTLCLRSHTWHKVEQTTFLGAGLLFWWPVIQPWPSASTGPRWSILLYLFLATLPCDILSGFLVFSDRVAYPVYLTAPRTFGFSALEDQQCAAALMWTCITLVYLVPAAVISVRLLAPQTSNKDDLTRPKSDSAARQIDSRRFGVV